MNNPLIYILCMYITVDVEAYPRIFLNGVYTNTNKLDKYYVNTVDGVGHTKVTKQDNIDINECMKAERREECLKLLKMLEKEPTEHIRRLSRNPYLPSKDFMRDSSEDDEKSLKVYAKFSQDYLDVNDLLRSGQGGVMEHPLIKQKPKKSHIFKIVRPNKFDRYAFDLTKFRRNNRTKKKKVYESDESDSSSSSESIETIRTDRLAKNKRFPIIDKSMESDTESSEEIPIKKKKNYKKNKDKYMYMQSPSRLYEVRRRLPHFFPKRYHWDEDDIKELRNYWFSGPQGKYWGQRT